MKVRDERRIDQSLHSIALMLQVSETFRFHGREQGFLDEDQWNFCQNKWELSKTYWLTGRLRHINQWKRILFSEFYYPWINFSVGYLCKIQDFKR